MFALEVGFLNSLPWKDRSFIFDLIKAFVLNTQISDEQLSDLFMYFFVDEKKNLEVTFFSVQIYRTC